MKRSGGFFALLVMLAGQAFATQPGREAAPAIHIAPEQALMDEAVSIKLSALPPNKPVTLKARTTLHGLDFQSEATFLADRNGRVDVSKQAPTSGTYAGVDPMGLFWSAKPSSAVSPGGHHPAAKISDPIIMSFDLEVEGRAVASAKLTRLWVRPGVRITEVREEGLVGRLFEPEKRGRHPGMLILSGSEGGISERDAALLASRGYTAFALAYFGIETLPKSLTNIPLDYLKKGIDWMKSRDSVDGNRLGVMGGSKGGELALLLGSMFPDLKVVIARAPSHVVWQGISGAASLAVSSWTYQGKPLPYVPNKATPAFTSQFARKGPVKLLDLYLPSLEDKEAVSRAAIQVEKINGAVLLISGKDDQMWPSSLMADMVIARLKEHKHPFPYRHLAYEGAGHAIPSAYTTVAFSLTAGPWALGGTPEANARAQADSWPQVLRFLRENLDKRV